MKFGHVYTFWLSNMYFRLDNFDICLSMGTHVYFEQKNNEALLHVHGVYLSFLVFNYTQYFKSVSYVHTCILKLKKE